MRRSLSWQIALTPHVGTEKSDEQIVKAQQGVTSTPDPRPQLERLGWLFVAKARESHDNGFYKLAEQCALALQVNDEKSPGGLLLRGHVAQSLHRFKEAEAIARQLVAQRELAFDHGLLGDALADQGKLDEAIAEYQRMVDLRPELQSYSRVAHARWLKGDLTGAIEAATLAVRAASPQNAEASAWAFTRLATFQAQAGAAASAEAAVETAGKFVPDYAPALLLRGRMLLTARKYSEASELLRRASEKNPLPEYQWALADALRAANRISEAEAVETELKRTGAANDPRTFALFLATRGEQIDLALRLAKRELQDRADIFTHDALAWAQSAAGHHAEAWTAMERALAEGTQDARLFLHAAVIAARLDRENAADGLTRARGLANLLLPSEREHLTQGASRVNKAVAPPDGPRTEAR
ncbi:MAG: tetratricopeptide repeat protein [Opitutaceae bacterium]|nr:tetratricopeptide repeat protein [Opitutaceae bacterium]